MKPQKINTNTISSNGKITKYTRSFVSGFSLEGVKMPPKSKRSYTCNYPNSYTPASEKVKTEVGKAVFSAEDVKKMDSMTLEECIVYKQDLLRKGKFKIKMT